MCLTVLANDASNREMLARIAVQSRVLVALIQCATMATEVVEVATESKEDVRFRHSGKNPMRFAVFWRISLRFCGFRTPLTPPSLNKEITLVHPYFSVSLKNSNATTLVFYEQRN